jgi:localization factor PodJL
MNNALSWSIRGLDDETLEAARAAARRAGKSLGDWLDDVVQEKAADGVSDDDDKSEDDDDRLRSEVRRLGHSAGRGRGVRDRRHWRKDFSRYEGENGRRRPRYLNEDEDRGDDGDGELDAAAIVDNAVSLFEQRAAETERRTTRAVADLIVNERRERANRDDGLGAIIDRLGRIESKISQQAPMSEPAPGASPRPEIGADRASAPAKERSNDFEQALQGLDQRLSEIARRLDQDARERDAKSAPISPSSAKEPSRSHSEPAARRPLASAIAEITQRQRALDSHGRASPSDGHEENVSPSRDDGFDASAAHRIGDLKHSIESISKQIETVRIGAAGQEKRQRFVIGQIDELRCEIEGVSRALGKLAPRSSIASIEAALRTLADRVETQRDHGVQEQALAPVERLASDLRSVIKGLDPGPIVRGLHADVQAIGRRLEELRSPGEADSAAIVELTRQTSEIRDLVASVAARPLPVERIESLLRDLSQRVDGLSLAGANSVPKDLAEVVRGIRAIIATATSGTLQAFGQKLENLGAKVDELLLAPSDGKRLDELGQRIDEVHQSLAARIDRGVAARTSVDTSQAEQLLSTLAKKIEASLEPKPSNDKKFAELAQRIDGAYMELAAKIEQKAKSRDSVDAKNISELLREMNDKLDASTGSNRGARALEALEQQIRQLSERMNKESDAGTYAKLDAFLSKPVADAQFEKLARRVDFVHTALTQKIEEGLRSRGAGENAHLADLIAQLARKMDSALDPRADSQTMLALEQQIARLSQRLDRTDKSAATLTSIEQTIGDLFRRIEEKQAAAGKAAEEAARLAAQDALREAAAGGVDGLNGVIERELAEIRQTHDESGRRTHETLAAVHDTLKRVVDRLAVFEDELTEIRNSSPAQNAGAPSAKVQPSGDASTSPRAADAPRQAEVKSIGPQSSDVGEFLLEPRKNPRANAGDEDARVPSLGPAHEQRGERSVTSDFIAAARRAAQEAAADAETALVDHARKNASRPRAQANARRGLEKIGSTLQTRKRPLLLALGALVMLIGAYQVARVSTRDTASPPARVGANDAEPNAGKNAGEAAKPHQAAPARSDIVPNAANSIAPGANSFDPQNNAPAGVQTPQFNTAPNQPAQNQAAPSRPLSKMIGEGVDATPVGSIERPGASAQESLAILKTLAAQGDARAQFELGVRYADGRGAVRDLKTAAQWLEKAASQGLAPAEYRLGSFYEKGFGVERDFMKARNWYARAAERGNARAMHNLAVLFAEGGEGGKPDYASAANWFRRAAELGVRDSQYNLAILYARGLGPTQNLQLSYMWFAVAAAQGDEDAGKKRDDVGARLDSKELAAARALVDEFRPRQPDKAANDVTPPAGGWENVKAPPKNGEKPAAKPKISVL